MSAGKGGAAGRIITMAAVDVRLMLRDRSAIFWVFIAPFLWVGFFGLFNKPQDPGKTQVGLAIVKQESSPLADELINVLKTENFQVVVVEPGQSAPTGDEAPSRTLTIPAGFSASIDKREKVRLRFAESKNANPEGTFATTVALHRAIMRVLGARALGGFDAADDLVTVASSWGGGRQIPSGRYQTIPGNLVMFVLIATITSGASLLANERKLGILRRLLASPVRRSELIAGKSLGRAAIAAVQVGVFVAMSLTIYRIDWGSSPAGLALLMLSFICAAAAIGLLGGALFASPDAAAGIGVVVVLSMSAIGGCWWPSEIMPAWLRTASYVFPTAWAMNGLHELLSWGGGLRDILVHCVVLTGFATVAATLAAWRLRGDS